MESINIYEAKTRFSQLVDRAAGGEDVVISRHGKPVARLTRLGEAPSPKNRIGVARGRFVAPEPDAALDAEAAALFDAAAGG